MKLCKADIVTDNDNISPEEEEEELYQDPPEEQTITTNHGKTSTHIYNPQNELNGIVIMLHGCGGKKEQYLEGKMAPRLASKYKIITFDWYGHGQSTSIPNNKYNKDYMVEQLHSVVTELVGDDETKKFHLYSFSLGNFLALHYMKLYPQRIGRVVLHSPWNAELSVFAPESLMRFSLKFPGVGSAGAYAIMKLYFPHCHSGETFRQILLQMGEGGDKWNELMNDLVEANVPSNVLLLCGEKEKPFFMLAKEIYEKLKDRSEMYTWKKADHMTWCEDWDKPVGRFFRDHVYDFLVKACNG